MIALSGVSSPARPEGVIESTAITVIGCAAPTLVIERAIMVVVEVNPHRNAVHTITAIANLLIADSSSVHAS